ncbi:MAG TPA: FAD-binding oxidoreductase [Kineosporiaceae bacterium]|nr:FAD-binding oxidoreductase [Kineosporiaceae bacterium]
MTGTLPTGGLPTGGLPSGGPRTGGLPAGGGRADPRPAPRSRSGELPRTVDAVVVGAGIVGAACAHELAVAGLSVLVVDRGPVAGGTTGRGEGNLLVSDKEPGPELNLALLSLRLWREYGDLLGPGCELEAKGGLVVASGPSALAPLFRLAQLQRAQGVIAQTVAPDQLPAIEPELVRGLAGGVFYPQDHQVQPMLATAMLLRRARVLGGAEVVTGCEVIGVRRGHGGEVSGVVTDRGTVATPVLVNAAGTWGGQLSRLAGGPVPVLPRRGFVLVTEPLPVLIRHKVYTAEYMANVASDDAALQTSTVVEGTPSGTVLIGASRERVGLEPGMDWSVIARLAARAVEVFPVLARARLLRSYSGFRPYCPDHLPVIGPDERVPGLFHACGHEGAGIGLAPATGRLLAAAVTDRRPELPLTPYSPNRFGADDAT